MINFRELRKSRGWSQMRAAKEVGVAMSTWLLWENGAGNPNPENMEKVMRVFDLKEGGNK